MTNPRQLNPQVIVDSTNSPPPMASFVFKQVRAALGTMLKNSVDTVIDLVYPPLCTHCLRVGAPLCKHCQAEIVPLTQQGSEPPIEFIEGYVGIGSHSGPLRSSIHALKYEKDQRQAEVLGALLANRIKVSQWTFDMIIPVPSDINRLKERGYNQAERIAHFLSVHLENQTVIEALHKLHHTESQVGKTAIERKENTKDAFAVVPQFQDIIVNKSILLIDDVCTTGSTLQVCTAALRDAGVKAVYVATVSRAGIGFDS